MNKYEVTIEVSLRTHLIVEAENENEARDSAYMETLGCIPNLKIRDIDYCVTEQ